jgi:hypothetical protein
MNTLLKRFTKLIAVAVLCLSLSSCEPPQVYGSVGYSSYGGGYGGGYGGMGGGVRIGGRIY